MQQISVLRQQAFTLIELVLVLLLVGILGAVAVPRLMLSNQFEAGLQADKLVGLLRLAQLRAMNDPQAMTDNIIIARCGKVVITQTGFSLARDCKSGLLPSAALATQAQQGQFVGALNLPITANKPFPISLQFGDLAADSDFLSEASLLGRPFVNGSRISAPLVITIAGKEVHIETEGYIHAP